MKRCFVFAVIIIASSVQLCFAQLNVWRLQNPLVAGNSSYAIEMLSLKSYYACGAGGMFLKTVDGGETWNAQINIFNIKSIFRSLSFVDQNYGMCCGDSGKIIKTTDGGLTWQLLPTYSTEKFNSIVVLDTNTALVVTLGGGIKKSIDGGLTWNSVALEGTPSLFSIRALRPDFLYITGYAGVLLKSLDTGKSWKKIVTPFGNTFFSALFTDDSSGTIVGDAGFIIHTSNGGISWTRQGIFVYPGPLTATMNCIDGKGGNNLSIVGSSSTIVNTSDKGTDWVFCNIEKTGNLRGISYFDSLTAVAIGDGTALKTTDGGKTWNYIPHLPFTDPLSALAFPKGDTSNCLAVGDYGTILRSTNGGQKWESIPIGWKHQLRGIAFMDSHSAIAVGDYGMILKTTDMGLTWNRQLSETSHNLYSVSFATPLDGLVAGDGNIILRTYSAGLFWTMEYAAPGDKIIDYFNCVSYPDSMHAFMTGFHGYYTSNDGGVNWKYLTLDNTLFSAYTFHAISFADSLHGGMLLSNYGAQIAQFTSDGGVSWFAQHDLPSTPLAIQFIDPEHATIVGMWGYIGHTIDSGRTLLPQKSNTYSSLHGICFGTLKAGTAVGDGGTIIRITTDEKFVSVHEQSASGTPKIIIDGNFPNPFSGLTTIRYHLPGFGLTTVMIFTTEGKNVATLANNFQTSGDHEVRFNASGLSSGTYICRITSAGMQSETKLKIEN